MVVRIQVSDLGDRSPSELRLNSLEEPDNMWQIEPTKSLLSHHPSHSPRALHHFILKPDKPAISDRLKHSLDDCGLSLGDFDQGFEDCAAD
jgi:hypothetical protein